jgi:uncharacterized alpha/beta hydrolase family protein
MGGRSGRKCDAMGYIAGISVLLQLLSKNCSRKELPTITKVPILKAEYTPPSRRK